MKSPTAARPAPAEFDMAAPVNIADGLGVVVGPTGVAVGDSVVAPEPAVELVPLVGYATDVAMISLLDPPVGGRVIVERVLSGQ
jgi:hypothetical protein